MNNANSTDRMSISFLTSPTSSEAVIPSNDPSARPVNSAPNTHESVSVAGSSQQAFVAAGRGMQQRLYRTESMVFSHDSSAGTSAGVPEPRHNRPAYASRSAPYPASFLPSGSRVPLAEPLSKRPSETEDQIDEHLHNGDGSLKTNKDIASAPGATGLGEASSRIGARRRMPGATNAQIDAHLYNGDGSLKHIRMIATSLRAAGFGADDKRIRARWQNAGGGALLPGATDAQIDEHLYDGDGSFRTTKDIGSALRAAGLGANKARIGARRRDAGGPTRLTSATDAQIDMHLYNGDGSLKPNRTVAKSLNTAGLGARNTHIGTRLQAARRAKVKSGVCPP